ncbi:MAG TPA: O-antigen ligase family protein [Candidatus Saccharimonadaceae bacterium]|nr:O-antigen ligase family protein [Candidatus Saccharimonadaceae bacterium]
MSKNSLALKLYGLLVLIIFGGIVITAPLTVWIGTLLPRELLIVKSWKEILMGVALVLACLEVTRHHLWGVLWRDWVVRLIAAFALLHVALLAWDYQGLKSAEAGILIDLRYVLYFMLVYVLVRIAPWYRLRVLVVGACGAVVVVAFGTLQLFLPRDILAHIGYGPKTIQPYLTVDKNPNYVRINSTLRGPNPLGAYVGIVLTAVAAFLARHKRRVQTRWQWVGLWIFTVCALVTLWLSYSRSAWLGTALALILVVLIVVRGQIMRALRSSRWVWVGAVIVILVAAAAFGRSHFIDNVVLHDNPVTGSKVKSDQAHLTSLENGTVRMLRQPLGGGIGSTGSASLLGNDKNIVENQYLFVAHESGWIGLVLFVALYVLVLLRTWRLRQDWLALTVFASGIGLALIGLMLPVFADDTVSIIWWGLAGVAYAGVESRGHGRKSSHQKTA